MSDQRKLTENARRQYDQMTAQELEALIRADLEAEDSSGLDSETLLYVLQLYARLRPDQSPKTAQEAFAEFRRDYKLRENGQFAVKQELSDRNCASEMHRQRTKSWRYITTAVAMVTLVLFAGLCVRAGVYKGGQAVYRQNRDCLWVSGTYSEIAEGQVLQTAKMCFPQWLPEGYECVQTRWNDEVYTTVYRKGDPTGEDCLTVTFQALRPAGRLKLYKNPEPAKGFTHDTVRFYLYTNTQWHCAVGCVDGVVFSIRGKVSDEEILRMVQSMELNERN